MHHIFDHWSIRGNKNTDWEVSPWPYFLCYATVVFLLWPKYLVTLPLFVNNANTHFELIERSCSPCTKERITLIKEMMRPEGVGYGSQQGNVTSQMLINQVLKMYKSSSFSLLSFFGLHMWTMSLQSSFSLQAKFCLHWC